MPTGSLSVSRNLSTLNFIYSVEILFVVQVTGRANYIHWLEDLLKLRDHAKACLSKKENIIVQYAGTVRGIDIGTGASCIYPLLGCALHDSWYHHVRIIFPCLALSIFCLSVFRTIHIRCRSFLATEIDQKSTEEARRNVDRNNVREACPNLEHIASHN